MEYRFKLKNSDEEFILDERGYKYLSSHADFIAYDMVHNFRKHSSGCAVFQKSKKQKDGTSKTTTFYLHKLIAEKFIASTKKGKINLVSTINGNKLDCRIDNLIYRSREQSSRLKKTSAVSGYTGVYQEGKRYRVIISYKKKSVHIGMFPSKEQAALAYNFASRFLYEEGGKINQIPDESYPKTLAFDQKKLLKMLEKIK